jgi:hypothetical protein
MIVSLVQLPALTRSWLAPLDAEDPELYDELSKDIVIDLVERKPQLDTVLPTGHEDVRRVLETIDLAGKQIGEFYFAPASSAGSKVEEQLAAYNRQIRNHFDIKGVEVFLGPFGENWVVATTDHLALLRGDNRGSHDEDMTLVPLAHDFASFILAQANAFDAFKRFIVEDSDLKSYRAAQEACAVHPVFQDTDVALIFECQLKG